MRHFRGPSVNESMLDGDNRACVDRGVAPPASHQSVCAVSWILIERKSAQSGMSLWQRGASAFFFFSFFWWWWLAEWRKVILCCVVQQRNRWLCLLLPYFRLSFIWAVAGLWMCILMSRRRSSREFNPALCLRRRTLPRGALIVNNWCLQEHIVCILMKIWTQPNDTKSSENQMLTSCFSLHWQDWGSWELQKVHFSTKSLKVL